MGGAPSGPRPEGLDYLDQLVDHEVSSVGISAGRVEGLSLDECREVADALGVSDAALRVVHVTGTNGKGTVCRLVEALVTASGLRVGTYLSPEGTVNERIRIDGAPISDEVLADALGSVRGVAEAVGTTLTVFEAVTLAALVAFSDAPVDVAVVEVGLLGRFDATNVVHGEVAVITNIAGDHTDFGPRWQERVAWEKAGIVKAGSIAVLGPIDDELVRFVEAEQPAEIRRWDRDFECVENRLAIGGRALEVVTSGGARIDAFVPLHGSHQGENVAVAAEAAEAILGGRIDPAAAGAALRGVRPAGRIEVVSSDPMVVIDGAHNADAAAALGRTLAESFTAAGRRIVVMAALEGRDPARFLAALHREFAVDLVVASTLDGPRALPATAVAAAAASLDLAVVDGGSVEEAVIGAVGGADVDDVVVVTGSFRLVERARAAVENHR